MTAGTRLATVLLGEAGALGLLALHPDRGAWVLAGIGAALLLVAAGVLRLPRLAAAAAVLVVLAPWDFAYPAAAAFAVLAVVLVRGQITRRDICVVGGSSAAKPHAR